MYKSLIWNASDFKAIEALIVPRWSHQVSQYLSKVLNSAMFLEWLFVIGCGRQREKESGGKRESALLAQFKCVLGRIRAEINAGCEPNKLDEFTNPDTCWVHVVNLEYGRLLALSANSLYTAIAISLRVTSCLIRHW